MGGAITKGPNILNTFWGIPGLAEKRRQADKTYGAQRWACGEMRAFKAPAAFLSASS